MRQPWRHNWRWSTSTPWTSWTLPDLMIHRRREVTRKSSPTSCQQFKTTKTFTKKEYLLFFNAWWSPLLVASRVLPLRQWAKCYSPSHCLTQTVNSKAQRWSSFSRTFPGMRALQTTGVCPTTAKMKRKRRETNQRKQKTRKTHKPSLSKLSLTSTRKIWPISFKRTKAEVYKLSEISLIDCSQMVISSLSRQVLTAWRKNRLTKKNKRLETSLTPLSDTVVTGSATLTKLTCNQSSFQLTAETKSSQT